MFVYCCSVLNTLFLLGFVLFPFQGEVLIVKQIDHSLTDHVKILAFALREQELQEILNRRGMRSGLGFHRLLLAMWLVRVEAGRPLRR